MDETTHTFLTTLEQSTPWTWPSNTRLEIVGLLGNGSSDVRRRVLGIVQPLMDDGIASAIVKVLEDPREELETRMLALHTLVPTLDTCGGRGADVLGEFALEEPPLSDACYADVLERFRVLVEDESQPDALRQEVLQISARGRQPWHRTAVERAWSSSDPKWRRAAVRAMRWIGEFDEAIRQACADDDLEVVRWGLLAAHEHWMESVEPVATRFAGDESTPKATRLAAIEALAHIGNTDSARLLQRLSRSRDPDVAQAADHALGEYELYSTIDDEDWPLEEVDSEWDLL